MCSESIKAHAVVLEVCAVPVVRQTYNYRNTCSLPAIQSWMLFSCLLSSFLAVCHLGDALSSTAVTVPGAAPGNRVGSRRGLGLLPASLGRFVIRAEGHK